MSNSRISMISKINVFSAIFICSLVLLTNGVVVWNIKVGNTINGTILNYIPFFLMLAMIVFNLSFGRPIPFDKFKKILLFLSLYYIYCFAYSYINSDFVSRFYLPFLFYLPVIFFYLYLLKINSLLKSFFNVYSKIMLVLSFFSLISYFLGEVLGILPSSNIMVEYLGETYSIKRYLGFNYIGQVSESFFGQYFPRNTSIWKEAPSFSGFLVPSFFYELFIVKRRNKFSLFILILACLTTFSMKGYIFFGIIGISYFFYSKKEKKSIFKVASIPIISVIVVLLFVLLSEKMEGGSAVVRQQEFQLALNAFIEKPIFGVGFRNYDFIRRWNPFLGYYGGNSSGLLALFAQGGIVIGAIFILSFIGLFLRKQVRVWLLVLVLTMMNSSTVQSSFFLFSIALGLIYLIDFSHKTNNKKELKNSI